MGIQIKGKNANITQELQSFLAENPPLNVKKPVIAKKKDEYGNLVHQENADGEKMYADAIVSTHPFVYFDISGNYYFRVFRSKVIDGREIIVTNPSIKTDEDCKLYGKGIESHKQPIPGSELWDNGSDSMMQHSETVSKGDPKTLITLIMTRDEVLAVDLAPTGDSLVADASRTTASEKQVFLEQMFGKDKAAKLLDLLED